MLESYLKPVLRKGRGLGLGVWGEAGIGKSYTLSSTLKSLPCQYLSLHATVSYAALSKALPVSAKFPLWVSQNLEKLKQQDVAEVGFVVDTLSVALGILAPFVLYLEDIHEVTLERLEFIQALAQAIKRIRGAALLVTSRNELPEVFTTVRLSVLDKEASDQLLQNELKTRLPSEALQWIYNQASGNPLYTLEYLRFLVRQGYIWNNGTDWHWRKPEERVIPSTVEALIELTLSQASKDETLETLVQGKAFLPVDASSALLEAVTKLDANTLELAKQHLRRQGILIADTFVHPLYREITLQKISKHQRQVLARRAVAFLKEESIQAVPFLEDAQLNTDESLHLLNQAVQKAKARKNDLQTGKLLAKTLQYLPEDQKAKTALEAATLLKYSAIEKATELARLATTLSQDKIPARLLQAELLAIQGHLQEAETLWQHVEISQPEAYRVGLVRLWGVAHHYSKVLDVYRQFPECFINPDAATTQWLVRSLAQLGFVDQAQDLIAKNQSQDANDYDIILLLKAKSDIAYVKADFAEMEKLEAEIYKHAHALGNLRVMDQALFNRAMALEGLGRYEERKVCLEEAMQVCQELGDVTAYMIAQRAYGSLLADFGDYDRAESYLQGARQYLENIDFFTYLLDCETTLSQFYRESNRSYSKILALKHAHAALVCAEHLDNPSNIADALCSLVMAYLDHGQIADAEEQLILAQQTLGDLELQQSQLSLIVTQAYIYKAKGQHQEALEHFDTAYQQVKQQGALLDEQRLGLERDYLRNDWEAAKERMLWFKQRNLNHHVTLAKRLFPSLDESTAVKEENGLRLEVLGAMQIQQDHSLETVRGRKRQEFLALLLEAKLSGRLELSNLDIVSGLYPDEELKASGNTRELVHQLRECWGNTVITTTALGYSLGDVDSDADQFLKTGDTSLWRGPYLEGLAIESQGIVSESLYGFLFEKAQEKLEGDPKETVRLSKVLLDYDPYHKDYLKLGLQAFRLSNNHKSLNRLYLEAKERFLEVGEKLPQQWQDFLMS